MRYAALAAAACFLLGGAEAIPLSGAQHASKPKPKPRPLKGKFLQITDLHPDPFYKYHSSVSEEGACHRDTGPAGAYGAEGTDCDSPLSLINATFKWIDENIKDEIDFVIWTGDSARHDNDEEIPRTFDGVTSMNEYAVSKFYEVWAKPDGYEDGNPTNDLVIPVVPTYGNNDILPHNIFEVGPNKWTKKYLDIWRNFIPESQRHQFASGGWFFSEVIPNKLAVFSLNSLYFFGNNAAVDGCVNKQEPGYKQLEWLAVQLKFLRQRGMKAILMGHVPPGRTVNKQSWDETCWQKYTLWNRQYRDVIVGSLWAHMNIEHFMLQDFNDIDMDIIDPRHEIHGTQERIERENLDEITIQVGADYLKDIREEWSDLPSPPKHFDEVAAGSMTQKEKSKRKQFFKEVGGEWAERFSLSLVSASVVPNYFPTLRIFEYNITNIDATSTASYDMNNQDLEHETCGDNGAGYRSNSLDCAIMISKVKIPKGPSKSSPPGPAYSPQTLSWLGVTELFANITEINNDFVKQDGLEGQGWKDGKHPNRDPDRNGKPNPTKFRYQLEYDTRNDTIYQLEDLTLRNWVKLAARIGNFRPEEEDQFDDVEEAGHPILSEEEGRFDPEKEISTDKKHRHKKNKDKKRRAKNKVWFEFVKRAFVGFLDEEEIHDEFGQEIADNTAPPSWVDDARWQIALGESEEEKLDFGPQLGEHGLEL